MNANNKRMVIMLPLLAVAAWLALFGDKTPVDEAATDAAPVRQQPATADNAAAAPEQVATATVAEPAAAAVPDSAGAGNGMPTRVIALRRVPLSEASAAAAAPQTETKDPFAVGLHLAKPPPPPEAAQQQQPPPPQFPYTFIGKQYNGGQWQVFLDKGESTLVVAEGAIIEKAYRIKSIRPPEMRVVELQSKHEHTIQIEDAQ